MPLPITVAIVTYQPKLAHIEKLLTFLKPHASHVVLIDNASKNQAELARLASDSNAHSILFDDNLGLGAAHNAGIEYANSNNCDYILLLDQDSMPDENMIAMLYSQAQAMDNEQKLFSAIGPVYYNEKNLHQSGFVKFGFMRFIHQKAAVNDMVEADFLISSGALISLAAIKEVGLMNESFFIDHVDTEWFLRAKHKGYNCYGYNQARMKHQLGEVMQRVWLGRWRMVPYHRSFRYYYIYRNSILMYKNKDIALQWKTADIMRLMKMFVVFAILSSKRKNNFSMMRKGIVDGIKGVSGRLL